MGVAILAIIGIGLLASLSPSTLVVFILLLTTVRPKSNAVGFLLGWTLSHTVSYVVEIVLGSVLAVVGARSWRHRKRPKAPATRTRRLETRLEHLHPWQAAAVGIAEQPWTLTAAAAVIVVHHRIGPLTTVVTFLLFTVFSTATVLAIFAYYTRHPDRSETRLAELRLRLARAGPTIVAAISLLASAYLLADGLHGLLG